MAELGYELATLGSAVGAQHFSVVEVYVKIIKFKLSQCIVNLYVQCMQLFFLYNPPHVGVFFSPSERLSVHQRSTSAL